VAAEASFVKDPVQEYGGLGPSSVQVSSIRTGSSGRRKDILHPKVFSVTGPVQEYDELGPSTIPGISTRTVVRIEETRLLDHSAQIISICPSMQVCSWISFKRLTNTSSFSDKKWYRE